MQQLGYSLIDAGGKELQIFGDSNTYCAPQPDTIYLSNGDIVCAPTLYAPLSDGSRLVKRFLSDTPPGVWFPVSGSSVDYNGTDIVKSVVYSTIADTQMVENAINKECSVRIYGVASDNSQKNMTANFVSGFMSSEDMATYKEGVQWIADMQAVCRQLIAAQDPTFTDSSHWPICSKTIIALAARY